MTASLILYIPDDPSAAWDWYVGPDSFGTAESLEERASLSAKAAKDICVILPGQWARIYALELPKMRPQDQHTAAGFSLEDKLGSGLKGQHIALSADARKAAVINTAKMKAVLAALSNAGIIPGAIYIDYDSHDAAIGPVAFQGRVIHAWQNSGEPGFAVDTAIYDIMPDVNAATPYAVSDMASALNTETAIDLLQGEFTARRFAWPAVKMLARAVCLTAVLGLTWLGWQGVNARAAKLQAAEINTQTRIIYEEATGQSAPSNPALAVTRALKSSGGSRAAFLDLSAILFEGIAQTDAIMVETLQFNADQNRLSIRLIYPSFEAASQLEQAIARSGGRLQAGGVREQGGQLIGDAVLSIGGGS